ncbi:hypothetical protein EGW08_011933 [Elysia chlorotica]|uniref:Uncharacterized protein n=1 Tax=Elysia chlorotica TaxID=188477 RepID=A0A3S1B5D6_ELYCH|nr:hypothetical protein EGW08_011933 [Elysia chlorotica]
MLTQQLLTAAKFVRNFRQAADKINGWRMEDGGARKSDQTLFSSCQPVAQPPCPQILLSPAQAPIAQTQSQSKSPNHPVLKFSSHQPSLSLSRPATLSSNSPLTSLGPNRQSPSRPSPSLMSQSPKPKSKWPTTMSSNSPPTSPSISRPSPSLSSQPPCPQILLSPTQAQSPKLRSQSPKPKSKSPTTMSSNSTPTSPSISRPSPGLSLSLSRQPPCPQILSPAQVSVAQAQV